jgi:hypothetical protein
MNEITRHARARVHARDCSNHKPLLRSNRVNQSLVSGTHPTLTGWMKDDR